MYVNHYSTFAGYPTVTWTVEKDVLKDGTPVAVAIRTGWDAEDKQHAWTDKFKALLENPLVEQIPALVIGMWDFEETVAYIVKALVSNRAKLPNLKALFVGDIT